MYEEIPVDHNTSICSPSTTESTDQNVVPRYCENPLLISGLGYLVSDYMSTGELTPHETTYLEPRHIGPGVTDDGVQPDTKDPHYRPLGEKTANPYALLN